MKIENKFVKINNGKKTIELRNTILDQYISKIIDNQFETNFDNRNSLAMIYAYIRLDNDLIFDKTSNLVENDFNIRIPVYDNNVDISSKQIVFDYLYRFEFGKAYDIQLQEKIYDFTPYWSRQIKAIGFGGTATGNNTIYACVDTSLYELYTLPEESGARLEYLSINREDLITTDTLFYATNNIVKGAVHLFDGQEEYTRKPWPTNQLIGVLHSVGISTMSLNLDIEQSLMPYSQHVEIDGNTINILDEFPIEYEAEGLFPEDDLYPSVDLYPERIVDQLFPSDDIYPNIDIYPASSPYQYMQLKYKVYRQNIDKYDAQYKTITDTGEYYILSKPIGNKEKVKMNIEYIGS